MNRFLMAFLTAVSFLLLASAIPLHAAGITDPGIGFNDPPNCSTGTPVFGAFTLSANSAGGGFACFVNGNADSPTITSVDIETSGNFFTDNCSPGSSILGFSNAFNLCSVTYFAAANVTDIRFSETPSIGSIAPGAVFEVDLNNAQSCTPQLSTSGGTCTDSGGATGAGGWGANAFFAGETNLSTTPTQPFLTTPEPSTISLLALGLMGMVAFLATKKKLGEIL